MGQQQNIKHRIKYLCVLANVSSFLLEIAHEFGVRGAHGLEYITKRLKYFAGLSRVISFRTIVKLLIFWGLCVVLIFFSIINL